MDAASGFYCPKYPILNSKIFYIYKIKYLWYIFIFNHRPVLKLIIIHIYIKHLRYLLSLLIKKGLINSNKYKNYNIKYT